MRQDGDRQFTHQTHPNWQKLNRLCKDSGYKLDEYARVVISANGKETLEDIKIWTDDEDLPIIDSDIKGNKVTFSIWHKGGIDDKTIDEYEDYVEKLKGVVKLLNTLKTFDFTKLYHDVEED